MSDVTSPSTELDAINLMLHTIGESPLNSLTDTTVVYAVTARSVLTEVSRTVQTRGWHFNTEKNFLLARDLTSKEINVPLSTIRVDSVRPDEGIDVVQRGTRLYDRQKHTFMFDKDIYADLVVALPFDELPETARYYIAVKAARVFQARTIGSDTLYQFTAQDERDALLAFKKAEGNTADHNILTGSWSVARILQRR